MRIAWMRSWRWWAGCGGAIGTSIDGAASPVEEAVEMADLIAGTRDRRLLGKLGAIVPEEYARVSAAGDERGRALYGLLAASLLLAPGGTGAAVAGTKLREAGAEYSQYPTASASLNVAALFGPDKRCVQRYCFWDDDDGVSSFENFKSGYAHDAAWKTEDQGNYIRIVGRGAGG
jgi:hypothetical protein